MALKNIGILFAVVTLQLLLAVETGKLYCSVIQSLRVEQGQFKMASKAKVTIYSDCTAGHQPSYSK